MSPTSPPAPVCCAGCYARGMHKNVYERHCVSSQVKWRYYGIICMERVDDVNAEGFGACGTMIITKGPQPKVFKQWAEYLRNNKPYQASGAAPMPPTTRR